MLPVARLLPFDVYEVEKADLKDRIKGKNLALIVDEVSDDERRYVLDIMAVIHDFDHLSPSSRFVAYLLETHFFSETIRDRSLLGSFSVNDGNGNDNAIN